jgi:hypothetical protein
MRNSDLKKYFRKSAPTKIYFHGFLVYFLRNSSSGSSGSSSCGALFWNCLFRSGKPSPAFRLMDRPIPWFSSDNPLPLSGRGWGCPGLPGGTPPPPCLFVLFNTLVLICIYFSQRPSPSSAPFFPLCQVTTPSPPPPHALVF